MPILGTERMGAGTVIASSGLVLTAHYLVIGARRVEVVSTDGGSFTGRVVGLDFGTGLAVIHLGDAGLPGLPIRQTTNRVVGEEAFVVASAGAERRVNPGVITSYASFEAFWEYRVDPALTCSAASPGLGGGPLVDAGGSMLGVIVLSQAEVGRFTVAVPAFRSQALLEAVASEGGFTTLCPHAWIGITCYPVGTELIVAAVLPNSPAEAAGLSSGDIIVSVDDVTTQSRRELYAALAREAPGSQVQLRIRRGLESLDIVVVSSSIQKFFDG